MKQMLLIVALFVSAMFSVNAQSSMHNTIVDELEYESFSSVKVSDDFIVTLVASDRYKTKRITDKRLESFVKTYVQNGTLYVGIDRKNFTPDLKKSLRAKGSAAPVIEVEIYFPAINSLELSGNAILHKSDVISSDAFTLIVSDKARVDKLYLDCKTAEINLYKSAYADVEAEVDETLYVVTSNSSKAVVKQKGSAVRIDAAGSSMVDAVLDVDNAEVVSSGSSFIKFVSGRVDEINVTASGSSRVDAESLAVPKGNMLQEGSSRCYMNVVDTLKVNLSGNTMLTFKDKPYIDVERILGSTLIKADDPKRK